MDPVLIVIAGAIAAGFVQGLSGFGFGLVAMSFWAWTLDPMLAAALSVFGSLTGQIVAAATIRRRWDLALLLPFILGGLCGIPLGVFLLPHLDTQWFKAILGTFLVLWCPAMLAASTMPRIQRGGRLADALAGMAGGIMSGIGGFSGTIPTLWCTLRGLDKDTQRAIIQNFNLAMLSVTFVIYLASGLITAQTLPMMAIVAPAMLIPTILGTRVYVGVSDIMFKRIVLGLLTCSGAALLASSLPALLQAL